MKQHFILPALLWIPVTGNRQGAMERNMTDKKVRYEYEYVGGKWGGGIPGIPARHLTIDDIKSRGIDVKILDESPLYEKLGAKRGGKK